MNVAVITKYFGLRDVAQVKQFIRFCLVGFINFTIHLVSYLLFTRVFGIHYLLANTAAWFIAVAFSFIMNKFWTFRSIDRQVIMQQYLKFFTVSIVALGMYNLLLYLFVKLAGFHDIVALIMSIFVVTFWNFFMNKFWTFKKITDGEPVN